MSSTRPYFIPGIMMAAVALAACGGGASKDYAADSPADQRASWGLEDAPTAAGAPAPAADAAGSVAESPSRPSRGRFEEERAAREPSARPGLGTEWGETRSSKITTSPFVRADAKNPLATAALFYNDAEGARAMASSAGFRKMSEGGTDVGGGILRARLKSDAGRFLTGFEAGGKDFVIGQAGERYSIVLQSQVPARLEVVVSVDGLDVIDGKPASFTKRGYLIEPHGSVEIDGFRQSLDTVAAFRFGAVRESYAEKKTGDARNVGVIGVAVFNEAGSNPSRWSVGEVDRRLDANPFPGQFATPP